MSLGPVGSSVYASTVNYPYGSTESSDTDTPPSDAVRADDSRSSGSGLRITRGTTAGTAPRTILGLSPTQLLLAGIGSTAIGVAAAGTIYAGARKGGWWNKAGAKAAEKSPPGVSLYPDNATIITEIVDPRSPTGGSTHAETTHTYTAENTAARSHKTILPKDPNIQKLHDANIFKSPSKNLRYAR